MRLLQEILCSEPLFIVLTFEVDVEVLHDATQQDEYDQLRGERVHRSSRFVLAVSNYSESFSEKFLPVRDHARIATYPNG